MRYFHELYKKFNPKSIEKCLKPTTNQSIFKTYCPIFVDSLGPRIIKKKIKFVKNALNFLVCQMKIKSFGKKQ